MINEDAERLYALLESEVIPLFYKRNKEGLPVEWIQRMRQSMAQLTLHYSSIRSLKEYTEKYYLPAGSLYNKRLANRAEEGKKIEEWKLLVGRHWNGIYYGTPVVETNEGEYLFSVPVFLNRMPANNVAIQLYAERVNAYPVVKQDMEARSEEENGTVIFSAKVLADRPSYHYTPRIIPASSLVSIPLECNKIAWQH